MVGRDLFNNVFFVFLRCCLKKHFVRREERLSVVEQQYLPNIELSKFIDSPGSGTTLGRLQTVSHLSKPNKTQSSPQFSLDLSRAFDRGG